MQPRGTVIITGRDTIQSRFTTSPSPPEGKAGEWEEMIYSGEGLFQQSEQLIAAT